MLLFWSVFFSRWWYMFWWIVISLFRWFPMLMIILWMCEVVGLLGNKDVRYRKFGDQKQSRRLDQIVLVTRMRCLGHVLWMKNSIFSGKFLLSESEIGLKRSCGGQVMTLHRGIKEATRKSIVVGLCCLPGWAPRNSAHTWLSTFEDMLYDQCQWCSCCNSLIDSHDW